jgi:uncharacterized surface protein with fasciclin (FAS1) repeats
MPAAVGHFWDFKFKAVNLPRPHLFIIGGSVLVLAAAGFATMASASTPTHSGVVPLYPSVQSTVPMTDMSQYTVAQIVAQLPLTTKFQMLAYNGGVINELQGAGPYTVFAPASNYFDYLPRSAYVGLTHIQMGEIASHMIVEGQAIPVSQAYSGSYITLAGDELNFTPRDSDQSAAVSDASASGYILRGYKAKNGVVYITNKVLVPSDLTNVLTP